MRHPAPAGPTLTAPGNGADAPRAHPDGDGHTGTHMTNPHAPHPAPPDGGLLPYDLVYGIAADPHWKTAGSTQAGGAPELHERRATRVEADTSYNLVVHDLAADYEARQRSYAAAHGDPSQAETLSRTELAAYAAGLTEDSPELRAAYERQQLLDGLNAASTIGDAIPALARISCPACWCWSALVPVPRAGGGWQATCQIDGCLDRDGNQSTFSLEEVVDHHLSDPLAA